MATPPPLTLSERYDKILDTAAERLHQQSQTMIELLGPPLGAKPRTRAQEEAAYREHCQDPSWWTNFLQRRSETVGPEAAIAEALGYASHLEHRIERHQQSTLPAAD